jgi:hypothetical protein
MDHEGYEAKNIESVCEAYWAGEGFLSLNHCVFPQTETPELFQVAFRAGFWALIERDVLCNYCCEYLKDRRVKREIIDEFCKKLSEKLQE